MSFFGNNPQARKAIGNGTQALAIHVVQGTSPVEVAKLVAKETTGLVSRALSGDIMGKGKLDSGEKDLLRERISIWFEQGTKIIVREVEEDDIMSDVFNAELSGIPSSLAAEGSAACVFGPTDVEKLEEFYDEHLYMDDY